MQRFTILSTVGRMAAGLACLLIISSLGDAAGVERRLVIHTNPPGALVKVDDHEIGTSPASTSFVYYGTRKIQLVKPGYETLTVLQPVRAPWYEFPGIDFFSEHIVPGQRRDVRVLSYNLQPKVVVPTDQLLQRAEVLRGAGRAPAVAPVAVPPPPGVAPIIVPSPAATAPITVPAPPGGAPLAPTPGRPILVPGQPTLPRPLPPIQDYQIPRDTRLPF